MIQQKVRMKKRPDSMLISVQSVKNHGTKKDVAIKKLSFVKV